jgi:hypothetical protein
MQMIPIESSHLKKVGYDAHSNTLTIEFKDGHIYEYYGVSPAIYSGLFAARSKGKYFAAEIQSKFRYSKVE